MEYSLYSYWSSSFCVFVLCKLSECYLFWTESWLELEWRFNNNRFFEGNLCTNQTAFTRIVMYIIDLVSFFPDRSYGVPSARSFIPLGLSNWTPWCEIYAKLLATADMEVRYKPKVLVSQIWNAVIISMYREHLLSIDNVQQLLYHQVASETDTERRTLRAPAFFMSQGDRGFKGEFFPHGSEAERRISFFAQSLTTHIPE